MSTEADIAEIMTHAHLYYNVGATQCWRTLCNNKYLLGFGIEEWQAKESLNHQVRIDCGWKRVSDHYIIDNI